MITRSCLVGLLVTLMASFGMAQEVYRPGNGVSEPSVISRTLPKYPREAAEAGIEGRVVMRGVVQTNGRMTDIAVTQSVDKRLDDAAMSAVRQWRFAPGKRDGKAVVVRYECDVTFTLQKPDGR